MIELGSDLLETKVVLVNFNSEQYGGSMDKRKKVRVKKSSNALRQDEKLVVAGNHTKKLIENYEVTRLVKLKNPVKAKVIHSMSHAVESSKSTESTNQNICDECGQHFTKRRSLMQHKTIHTKERPFECWLCHKL